MSAETWTRFFHVRSRAVGRLSSPREGRPGSLDSRFATLGGHGALAPAWSNVEKNKTQRVQMAVGSWSAKGVKGHSSTDDRRHAHGEKAFRHEASVDQLLHSLSERCHSVLLQFVPVALTQV